MLQTISLDKNKTFWYVLRHPEPAVIDKLLQSALERRREQGQPTFLHLVPYTFLSPAEAADNTLRSDFHSFVFLRSTKRQIDLLLHEDWNALGRLHLHYVRNHSRRPIRLTEHEMSPFIALFVQHRQRYSFRPFTADTAPQGGLVRICKGLFKGYDATVVAVKTRGDALRLTLSIPVFNNVFSLQLFECAADDVEVPGGDADQVFRPYFLYEMERNLFQVLRRRVTNRDTDATRQQDRTLLDSYSVFHYLTFDDPSEQLHFQSLLLLCATLRKDHAAKATLLATLKPHLPKTTQSTPSGQTSTVGQSSASGQTSTVGQSTASGQTTVSGQTAASQISTSATDICLLSDTDAFLAAVLFVATRKGTYRKSVKTYVQSRSAVSDSLKTLTSLIKDLPSR